MIAIALHLVTGPAREPLSLASAKLHLRVDTTDEDNLIQALITAARRYCEGFQNRCYLAQTYDLWLDGWPDGDCIRIPMPPLQSVMSVKYYGTDDTEHTLAATEYFVDNKSEPGRLALNYGNSWPTVTLRPINAVAVRFVAGHPAYSSTVDVADTAVTKTVGDDFNSAWSAGKTIAIAGAEYRIASVKSTTELTLATAGSKQNGVLFEANDVPETVIQAMKLLVGYWYENRELALVGTVSKEIEFAVSALLWLNRVVPV